MATSTTKQTNRKRVGGVVGEMRLVFGRAGTGKTTQAITATRKFLDAGGDPSRVWILQPSADAGREFVRELAGTRAKSADFARPLLGVQVHTFASLSLTLFDLAGLPRPRLLPVSLRPAMVREALRHVIAGNKQFRRLTNRVGYRRLLTEFIAESLRNRVYPDALGDVPGRLRATRRGEERGLAVRAELLAGLLHYYAQLCDEWGFLDPEQLPDAAADLFNYRERDRLRLDGRLGLFVADNFSKLSDSELALLAAVAARAESAICTLSMPAPAKNEPINAEPARSFAYLKRTFNGIELFAQAHNRNWKYQELPRARRFRAASIAHLERELFHAEQRDLAGKPLPPSPDRQQLLADAAATLETERSVLRFVAPSIQEECEWIAGEARRLHTQEGVPIAGIAVVHRDSASYDPLLRSAFARAGLPIDLPRTVTLSNTPLWWLARDLVGAALRDPDDPGGARTLLANPLFDVDITAKLVNEGLARGLWTQREWLTAGNYQDPRTAALVGTVNRVVQALRQTAMRADFSAGTFADILLTGLDDLGVTRPPLDGANLAARRQSLFDPTIAEMIRERVEVVRACRTVIRTTAAMLDGRFDALDALGPMGLISPAKTAPLSPGNAPDLAAIAATNSAETYGTLNIEDAGRMWEAAEEAARLRQIRTHREGQAPGVICGDIGDVFIPGDIQVMFVAGLIQGVFPPPPITDPVLPDRDRKCLNESQGVWYEERAAIREYEDFLFYTAISRAASRLYLCHPERDSAGNETMPSLYLRDVAAAFGVDFARLPMVGRMPFVAGSPEANLNPNEIEDRAWLAVAREAGRPGGNVDRALAALCEHPHVRLPWRVQQTPAQLIRWTVRTLWRPRTLDGEALAAWHAAAAIWDRYHAQWPGLKLAAQAGFNDPHRAKLSATARQLLRNEERILSASGINTFANCPYKFFARYHLNLEEQETAEPDPRTWGSLHHLVLEELGKHMLTGTVPSEPKIAADWARHRVTELAHDEKHGFPKLLIQRRYQAELRLQAEKLRAFVLKDVRFRAKRGVLPVGFEVPFGFGPKTPDELAQLVVGPPGQSPIYSPEPLTLTDAERRITLRIRGYIDLLEAAQFPDSRGRRWAVVVDYKSGPVWKMARRLKDFTKADKLALETKPADEYVGSDLGDPLDFQIPIYIMAARELFGFEVASAFFYSLAKREKRGLCRNDHADLHADGELSNYDMMSPGRFDEIVENARQTLVSIAGKIDDGEIAINPHDCAYCEFRDLCRFDKKQVDMLRSRQSAAEKLVQEPAPNPSPAASSGGLQKRNA